MQQGLRWRVCGLAASAALLAIGACVSPAKERARLESSYPLDRVEATVRLANAGDAEAVYQLVSLLEDRDRAVRMYAILGLKRLCGETYGYRYYAPEADRMAAVRRWREALRKGEVKVGGKAAVADESEGVSLGTSAETGESGRD